METMGVEYHKQGSVAIPSSAASTNEFPISHLPIDPKNQNLLTMLMLLGARLSPELEAARDKLVLEQTPRQRIVSLLGSAILEDSRIFVPQRGQLFAGILDSRWIHVRKSTFTDKPRMVQILEAVDPRGLVWPELCQTSSLSSWVESGDCAGLVEALLNECNLEYTMFEHFIQIHTSTLFENLAWALIAAPTSQVDVLYSVLFSPENLRAIADAVQVVALQAPPDVVNDSDLGTSLKLLVGFLSLFFGAGLVLGHSMSPPS